MRGSAVSGLDYSDRGGSPPSGSIGVSLLAVGPWSRRVAALLSLLLVHTGSVEECIALGRSGWVFVASCLSADQR